MLVYKYGNYVTDDKDKLEERIADDIACHVKSLAKVEVMAENAYDDIEEVIVNPQAIFKMMREGFIFLPYARELK